MIKSLSSLRLIFAILIFLHHFPYQGKNLFMEGGSLGVCFFIILSGFVMSLGYGEKTLAQDFDYKKFFFKRIIRLWPLHLLCLAGCIILKYHSSIPPIKTIVALVINGLMLQSWIPDSFFYFSGNSVSWCLGVFVFCYALFPFLYRFIINLDRKSLTKISAITLISYIFILSLLPKEMVHALAYISPAFRILDFVIGIILYRLYQRLLQNKTVCTIANKANRLTLTCIEIIPILLVVVGIFLFSSVPQRYGLISFWWPSCIAVILIFSLSESNGGGYLSAILQNQKLVKVSTYSFTFYMIHGMSLPILRIALSYLPFQLPLFVDIVIRFVIILLLAWFINKYYEAPISRYLSNKI